MRYILDVINTGCAGCSMIRVNKKFQSMEALELYVSENFMGWTSVVVTVRAV